MLKHTAIAHVSGGLDSAASYLWARRNFERVISVFYGYGQPYYDAEYKAASRLVRDVGGASLISFGVPLGMTDKARVSAYVPYRNLVLLSHSLNFAASVGAAAVVIGCKSESVRPGDSHSFLDSTHNPFVILFTQLAEAITEPALNMPVPIMPLAGWSKARVLRSLIDNDVDPDTLWTCYGVGPEPCGECAHCVEYAHAKVSIERGR